jgi:branched-chain amino acid transport system ATP-binding protein
MWAGLDQHPRDLAGSLSYGHQKLLALACCVARAGAVLLLDEPIAGVHPELAEVILGRLAALRQEGRLVVLIEHDLAAVRQIADVVVVMEAGRVIAQGPPVEVLDRPEVVSAFIV